MLKTIQKMMVMLMVLMMISAMNSVMVSATLLYSSDSKLIKDTAGILSKEDQSKLETALSDGMIQIHVQTQTGLTETETKKLAQQVYKENMFKTNDVSVVVSTNPNFVFAYYDNASLKAAVHSASTKDIKGLIDATFVPMAKEGKVAEGIIALSNAFNGLTTTEVVTTPSASETTSSSGNGGWIAIAVILILGALAGGVTAVIHRKNTKDIAEQAMHQVNCFFVKLSELEQITIMQDYQKQLVTGKTQKLLRRIDDQVSSMRQQMLDANQTLERGGLSREQARGIIKWSTEHEKTVMELIEEVQQIESSRLTMSHAISEMNSKMATFDIQVAKLQETTSYPLEGMKNRIKEAKLLVEAADEADDFDLVDAQQKMNDVSRIMDSLKQDIEQMRDQFVHFANIPNMISQAKERIDDIVKREELKLVDVNPYQELSTIDELLGVVGTYLRSGYTSEALLEANKIRGVLTRAVSIAHEIIQKRDQTEHKIQLIEQKIQDVSERRDLIQGEIQKIAREFDEKHYLDMPSVISECDRRLNDVLHIVPTLKTLNSKDEQQYNEAAKGSEEVYSIIQKIDQKQKELLHRYTDLRAKQDKLGQQLNEIRSIYQRAVSEMDRQTITATDSLRTLAGDISRWFEKAVTALQARPLDIDLAVREVQSLQSHVKSFHDHALGMIKQKQDAERKLRELRSSFSASRSRYGSRVNVSRYSSQYDARIGEAERLITMGLFVNAMTEMSQAESTMQDMRREHDRMMEEERRQEESRSSSSSSSTSDTGGSSWSSDSSTSSDSSSSDSGGSSW